MLLILFCRYLTEEILYFLPDLSRYLNEIHEVDMPPNQQWHCNISMTMLVVCQYCSTLFILFMTFERFYSIIKPHKAASFNTVNRAKITITCIVCFSSTVCLPNLFFNFNHRPILFHLWESHDVKIHENLSMVQSSFCFSATVPFTFNHE